MCRAACAAPSLGSHRRTERGSPAHMAILKLGAGAVKSGASATGRHRHRPYLHNPVLGLRASRGGLFSRHEPVCFSPNIGSRVRKALWRPEGVSRGASQPSEISSCRSATFSARDKMKEEAADSRD